MNKKLIKEDINFLEFPSWVVSERNDRRQIVINKDNGEYKISTSLDCLPSRVDKLVLYYFLLKLWKETEFKSTKTIAVRYQAAIDIFDLNYKPSNHHYKKIMDALEKWSNVNISFRGVFYEGDDYKTRFFSIIDDVILNEDTKELYIKFNEQYVKQLEESKFYKFIDYNEYKKLKRPISARLYEVLGKTFKNRKSWSIGIIKLAEKLTLSESYPSHILHKLKPAVNEINENTDLNIDLEYNKKTKICIFSKVSRQKIEQIQEVESIKINIDYEENPVLKNIQEELEISESKIIELLDKYDIDKMKNVYEYVKDEDSLKNPAGFFIKALEDDYKILSSENKELKEKITVFKQEANKCYKNSSGSCAANFKEAKNKKYKESCYWCKKFEKFRLEDTKEKPEFSKQEMNDLEKINNRNLEARLIETNSFKKKMLQKTFS